MAIGNRTKRRLTFTTAAMVTVGSTLVVGGCNAILGIDEGHLVGTDAGKGAGGASAGSGGSSPDGSASGGSGGGATDSGAGGASAGGRGAGGNGAGGKSTGGTAGAGGSGGAGDSGTGGAASGVPGEVRCGTASCKLATGQACCVATATGDAHCSTSCDASAQVKFSCDGAEDCTGTNDKCCYPFGATTATCAATCTGRVFCGADRDCAPGQYCAPGTGVLATVSICTDGPKAKSVWCDNAICDVSAGKACCYSKTTKKETCVAASSCGASDVRFACDGTEDCAAGSACCETRTGLGLLTGSQCVIGACPSGVAAVTCGGANGCSGASCCLQGTAASCSAQCASKTVCGTSADCAGLACSVVTDSTLGQPTGRTLCTAP